MIPPRSSISRLTPYVLADLGPDGAVSLAQNESAFAPSPRAVKAGVSALSDARLYPDPDWRDLRSAIAKVHMVSPEAILCGAGSMELIGASIRAYAGPEHTIVGSAHGYLFAETAAQQTGARFERAPETDLTVSVDAILEVADRVAPRIVFVCNPGNPTGTRIPNGEILRLREALAPDALLIVDQAYGEFDTQPHRDIFDLAETGRTVVLRTFSKAYGLAGARVGWGIFPKNVAAEVRKLLNPNNTSGASQAVAAAAMRDQDFMESIVEMTAEIRSDFTRRVRAFGIGVPESHTNFVLLRFSSPDLASCADRHLRGAGFVLRGMGGYGLPAALRATIGEGAVMDALADRLEEFMGKIRNV